jgi:5-methylcytosine-specific restriction endonuclease McrA
MKKPSKRVSKVVKLRNAGTMSEATFWQFIRNSLRRRSIVWKPISLCKERCKRRYTGVNKRQRFEYQCNVCKNYFKGTEIDVDHVIPVGSLQNANDLPHFVEALFCEVDNLQCICRSCHDAKTKIDNVNTKKK